MYDLNTRYKVVQLITSHNIDIRPEARAVDLIESHGSDAKVVAQALFDGAVERYKKAKTVKGMIVGTLVNPTSDIILSDRYKYVTEVLMDSAEWDIKFYRKVRREVCSIAKKGEANGISTTK